MEQYLSQDESCFEGKVSNSAPRKIQRVVRLVELCFALLVCFTGGRIGFISRSRSFDST